jgi:hypothetical protein
VQTANPLDVIFARCCYSSSTSTVVAAGGGTSHRRYRLLPNHTGNNRCAVMVDLARRRYYGQSSPEQREKICLELVVTVQEEWNGKFLLQRGEDEYALLTDGQAVEALKCVFEPQRQPATSAPPASVPPLPPDLSSQSSDAIKQHTMEQLQRLMPSADRSAVHKRAIASLRKKKKRQTVGTKISRLVREASSSGGGTAAATAAPAMSRAATEPAARGGRWAPPPPPTFLRQHVTMPNAATATTTTVGGAASSLSSSLSGNNSDSWKMPSLTEDDDSELLPHPEQPIPADVPLPDPIRSSVSSRRSRISTGGTSSFRGSRRLSEFSAAMIQELMVSLDVLQDDEDGDDE